MASAGKKLEKMATSAMAQEGRAATAKTKELHKAAKQKKKELKLRAAREGQGDFFLPVMGGVKTKGDQHSMQDPFFSLDRDLVREDRVYRGRKGQTLIEISNNEKYGMPTQWDKDILLFCASQIVAHADSGVYSPKVETTPYALLKAIGKSTGGTEYDWLDEALNRLMTTKIKTNLISGTEYQEANFSIISETTEKGKLNAHGVRERANARLVIHLSDFIFRACVTGEILTYHPDYFALTSPLHKRLYELARKHLGEKQDGSKKEFRIGLQKLFVRTGMKHSNLLPEELDLASEAGEIRRLRRQDQAIQPRGLEKRDSDLKKFKGQLANCKRSLSKLAGVDLLGYSVEVESKGRGKTNVVFRHFPEMGA